MALYTSTPVVAGILPAQYGPLIVQPVTQNSVAMRTSTILQTSAQSFNLPVIRSDVGAAFVFEGAEIAPSDPTFAELTIVPQKLAGLTIISDELAHDSTPGAQAIVGMSLARSMAKMVDRAWLNTLPLPAPPGLTSLTGTYAPSTVDAGTAWAGTDPFAEALSLAEVDGGTMTAFVASPADVLALARLKAGTQLASPLFGMGATSAVDRTILGVPLVSCNMAPAGTIWGICQERTFVIMRTEMSLAVSSDVFFTSDRIAIRALMRIGFGFPAPSSVVKISLSA